jgi:hypothetical protein
MRDRETIDSELRRLLATGELSRREIDDLLDERLGHRPAPAEPAAVAIRPQRAPTSRVRPRRRSRHLLRRFGLPAVLPLSLLAAGAVLVVVLFGLRNPHPAAQQAEDAASSVRPAPAAPIPPSPPVTRAPQLPLLDRAFIDTLKQEGVPVPSNDYVLAQAHGVCDFLAHQSDFAAAVQFVQRSSIWDADQSTNVAAGAIVSYCPQYQPTSVQPAIPDQLQQTFQKAQSDLQAIEGDLQGIRDGLPGGLP